MIPSLIEQIERINMHLNNPQSVLLRNKYAAKVQKDPGGFRGELLDWLIDSDGWVTLADAKERFPEKGKAISASLYALIQLNMIVKRKCVTPNDRGQDVTEYAAVANVSEP